MPPKVNLRKFLIAYRDDASPIGDLARDVFDDPTFPRGKRPLTNYEDYLWTQRACYEAEVTLKKAFALALSLANAKTSLE